MMQMHCNMQEYCFIYICVCVCCALVGLNNKLPRIVSASETKSYTPEGKLIKFIAVKMFRTRRQK